MFLSSYRPALRLISATRRLVSTSSNQSSRREFKVVLDNDTLYVEQPLAEALGWKPDTDPAEGIPLTLSGWAPGYFVVARTGSDSDMLARGTVESSRNPRVQQLLEYLRDK